MDVYFSGRALDQHQDSLFLLNIPGDLPQRLPPSFSVEGAFVETGHVVYFCPFTSRTSARLILGFMNFDKKELKALTFFSLLSLFRALRFSIDPVLLCPPLRSSTLSLSTPSRCC